MEKTNYILHLNQAFGKFCDDDRLSPYHISLYFSLFHYWNLAKFRNPISISRAETMHAAKIGSVNTYIRSMKELHTWGYFEYQPSYNPLKGSKVHMFNFDNAKNKTKNNASDISTNKAGKKASAKTRETLVIPSKNKSNNKNNSNKTNAHEPKRRKNNKKSLIAVSRPAKSKNKKVLPRAKSRGQRPGRRQVETHFTEKQWPAIEAQKFFNYYQSNGWLVGGKTPMRSWQAAARNWMLNSEKFNATNSHPERSRRAGKLQTTQNKNYAEPL